VKIKKISFLQNSIFEIWEKKTKNSFPGLSIVFDRFLFKIQILNENDKSTGLSHGFSDFSFFKILKF
jgi:replicative DNA helicase